MELIVARQIIDTLAQGIHPITGEAMPEDSPYNSPPVIRALHAVSRALEAADRPAPAPAPVRRPPNAGKPWSAQEDAALEVGFDAGIELQQLARELGRTVLAVEQRLVKLEKIAAPVSGGRYAAASAH